MTCGPRPQDRHTLEWVPVQGLARTLEPREYFHLDELIQLLAQRAGITPAQAEIAIACVLGYLTARLPSPVVGRIREQLGGANDIQ